MKKLIIFLLILAIIGGTIYFLFVITDNASGTDEKTQDEGETIQSKFTIHPNKDPQKAKAGLEKAGYDVSLETYTTREDGMIACVDASLDTEEMDDFEWLVIYYYKDKAAADADWPEIEKDGEELMEAAVYMGYASSFVCKKNGTVIYYGTKNAVAAAK